MEHRETWTEEQPQWMDTGVRAHRYWRELLPYPAVKRAIDIALAGAALVLLAPFMLLVALAIYLDDPHGSPIFVQDRVGRGGRVFRCLKFRSMTVHAPRYRATSELADPARYVTRVGRVIRRLSVDELMQLVNVLKGEMSLVGPRPLIPNEAAMHAGRSTAGVYEVLPGLTGLAQINGRDMIDDQTKLAYDIQYVRHLSLYQDARILAASAVKALRRADIL